jgi:hypothetical protein
VDDELNLDLDVGEPEADAAPAPTGESGDDPRYRKLQNENRSLRERLRRSEIQAEHGEQIASLIPTSLPLNEWPEYAEKLSALIPKAPAPESADSEPANAPSEERTEREERLAAVAAPQATGTQPEVLSAKEIGELMKSDPAAGLRAANARYSTPS